MNVWRRGSLLHNPYYRTAFRVARVPPEIVQHRTIVSMIGQTRRLVRGDPNAHRIQGMPVTDADINQAEKVLLDPRTRIAEDLIEHPTEELPLERVRQLADEVAAAMAPDGATPLKLTNPAALADWPDHLMRVALEAMPVDPSFGALELELIPPYGLADEA